MTRVRIGESVFEIPDESWEIWVRSGRIPPDAWILSPVWTQGVWRPAEALETYHLFLPGRQRARPGRGDAARAVAAARGPGVLEYVFPRRGLSVTESLVLLNLAVAGVLILAWREEYQDRLWWLARFLRAFVGSGWGFFVSIVPMFLHANPSHLFSNLVGLLAAGAAAEYLYGRGTTLGAYLLCGYGGAAASLLLRTKTVLSVGASGAIFGLYGLILVFILRHGHRFPGRQRWKAFRVYLPILVLALIPSLFGADLLSHVGGFATGCFLGLFLPPGPRIRESLAADAGEEAA